MARIGFIVAASVWTLACCAAQKQGGAAGETPVAMKETVGPAGDETRPTSPHASRVIVISVDGC